MSSATDSFLVTLRLHHLLEPAQLDELGPGTGLEPKALAAELIRRDWLTPYQVNQVLGGRAGDLLLGNYVLVERLGEGGMGAVFKARNWKLGRVAALKLIRKDRLANEDAVRRFRREVRAAAQLTHPNIVHAYDADEVNGTHFFVMEYVLGPDLAHVLKEEGPLPVAAACDYVRQAALGLQHAHERGLVHRDIKPANLLRTYEGVVKILDMGLAHLSASDDDGGTSTITQEGMVMGTLDYISPEQSADSHNVDIRADLYSLGCTFYHLLAGRPPFPPCAPAEKLFKHRYEEPAPLERWRSDVPPAIAAVVAKLMAKLPADRYQAPAELAAVLASEASMVHQDTSVLSLPPAAAGGSETTGVYVSDSTDPDSPQRPRRRLWLWAALLPLLLLLAMVGHWIVTIQRKVLPAPDTADARNSGDVEKTPAPKKTSPGVVVHDSVGARVTTIPESRDPPGPGARGLTDGLLADGDDASSNGWVGWDANAGPVQITLDLEKPTRVTKLGAHFLRATHITLPVQVEFLVSSDGKTFERVATLADRDAAPQRGWYTAEVKPVTARRVRVRATPGLERLYVDEVAVNPQPDEPNFRHAALGRPVKMVFPAGGGYTAPGEQGLTDGFIGRSPDFLNLQWLGIEGRDLNATIDMGRETDLHEVGGHFLQSLRLGIRVPSVMDVLVSSDGKAFRTVATVKRDRDEEPMYMQTLSAKLKGVTGRYVRVVAHSPGGWLFADEVFVNPEP